MTATQRVQTVLRWGAYSTADLCQRVLPFLPAATVRWTLWTLARSGRIAQCGSRPGSSGRTRVTLWRLTARYG